MGVLTVPIYETSLRISIPAPHPRSPCGSYRVPPPQPPIADPTWLLTAPRPPPRLRGRPVGRLDAPQPGRSVGDVRGAAVPLRLPRGAAAQRRQRPVVLRQPVPQELPAGGRALAARRRARELRGPGAVRGGPGVAGLHPADGGAERRAGRQVLLPGGPRGLQPVQLQRAHGAGGVG